MSVHRRSSGIVWEVLLLRWSLDLQRPTIRAVSYCVVKEAISWSDQRESQVVR